MRIDPNLLKKLATGPRVFRRGEPYDIHEAFALMALADHGLASCSVINGEQTFMLTVDGVDFLVDSEGAL
jgi:hypothetical protein